jgi:hypothetical protein
VPTVVPPFVPYQAPLIALRGLWNNPPPEGDKFVPCEIDWSTQGGAANAVQLALSSFSPVQFSQIVALYVDNGANGADVSFLFPDTGKQLTVPAYCQGLFPVITNSLTFYVISTGAGSGDITIFQILNSMPPPVAVLPSQEQQSAAATGLSLGVDNGVVIVAAPTVGTLNAFSINMVSDYANPATFTIQLKDGLGHILFQEAVTMQANSQQTVALSGLRLRFYDGLLADVLYASGVPSGEAIANINAFYSVP